MSQVTKTSTDIEKAILKAIHHLDQTRGSSMADILRYLSSKKLLNMANSETIVQTSLNDAVDKGLLKKLANGKYKVKETARRRKSSSRSRSKAKPKRRSRSRKSRSRSRSRAKPKRRSRSRKRSGSRRRRRSSSGRRRKRSSSGRRRKRSASRRRRSRRRTEMPEE